MENMTPEEGQKLMFGTTQEALNVEWRRIMDKGLTKPDMVLMSVLSDIQELIEISRSGRDLGDPDALERARQKINVVKYWMTGCCNVTDIKPAGPKEPFDVDDEALFSRDTKTGHRTADASTLGWTPGEWPMRFSFIFGKGYRPEYQYMARREGFPEENLCVYTCGTVRIDVLND